MTRGTHEDLTGRRFGRWVVVRRGENSRAGEARWYCRCDNHSYELRLIQAGNLKGGHSTRCKRCSGRENSEGGKARRGTAGRQKIAQTKCSAASRSLEYSLNDVQAFLLYKQPCYYCGKQPSHVRKAQSGETFLCNGIDRVDNSIGYVVGNCVSCCGRCNAAKHTQNQAEYIEQCIRVAKIWAPAILDQTKPAEAPTTSSTSGYASLNWGQGT